MVRNKRKMCNIWRFFFLYIVLFYSFSSALTLEAPGSVRWQLTQIKFIALCIILHIDKNCSIGGTTK